MLKRPVVLCPFSQYFRSISILFTFAENIASPIRADASSMRLQKFLADLEMLQLVRNLHTSRFRIKISGFSSKYTCL
jgi:hypothetical protein